MLTLMAHAFLDRVTKNPKLALTSALEEEVCQPLALHLKTLSLIGNWEKIAWPLVVSPRVLDWTRKDFSKDHLYYVRQMKLGDHDDSSPRVFLLAVDRCVVRLRAWVQVQLVIVCPAKQTPTLRGALPHRCRRGTQWPDDARSHALPSPTPRSQNFDASQGLGATGESCNASCSPTLVTLTVMYPDQASTHAHGAWKPMNQRVDIGGAAAALTFLGNALGDNLPEEVAALGEGPKRAALAPQTRMTTLDEREEKGEPPRDGADVFAGEHAVSATETGLAFHPLPPVAGVTIGEGRPLPRSFTNASLPGQLHDATGAAARQRLHKGQPLARSSVDVVPNTSQLYAFGWWQQWPRLTSHFCRYNPTNEREGDSDEEKSGSDSEGSETDDHHSESSSSGRSRSDTSASESSGHEQSDMDEDNGAEADGLPRTPVAQPSSARKGKEDEIRGASRANRSASRQRKDQRSRAATSRRSGTRQGVRSGHQTSGAAAELAAGATGLSGLDRPSTTLGDAQAAKRMRRRAPSARPLTGFGTNSRGRGTSMARASSRRTNKITVGPSRAGRNGRSRLGAGRGSGRRSKSPRRTPKPRSRATPPPMKRRKHKTHKVHGSNCRRQCRSTVAHICVWCVNRNRRPSGRLPSVVKLGCCMILLSRTLSLWTHATSKATPR